jgi:hypothetical protein
MCGMVLGADLGVTLLARRDFGRFYTFIEKSPFDGGLFHL